jgi:hypothetical protein
MRLGLGLRLRRLGRWVSWVRHRFHALRHHFHALRRQFSDKTVTYIPHFTVKWMLQQRNLIKPIEVIYFLLVFCDVEIF